MSNSLPKVPQTSPYKVELEANRPYSWCQCGLSQNQPFCDGSHSGTAYSSVKLKFDEPKTVWLCGCKHTKTPPYCDGSHIDLDMTS